MLSSLTIQNFGLIDKVSIDFSKSLNILTGETGAGKSILIDALRFVLGERLNSSFVRNPDISCTIEAVFDLTKSDLVKHPLFEDFVSKEDPLLIIQRDYQREKSKIKINGLTVTITQLKAIGDQLVDFHGAHDHQLLLSEESHLRILDRLIDFGELRLKYADVFGGYLTQKRKLEDIKNLSQMRERDVDFLKHQIKELEQIALDQKAYEILSSEHARLSHAQKLYECAAQLIQVFEDERTGVNENIRQAFGPLKGLNQIDEETCVYEGYLNEIQQKSQQLINELHSYADGLSFQPEEVSRINQQYDVYQDIIHKYGPSLEDASKFYHEIKDKYNALINLEENTADLNEKIQSIEKDLRNIAQKITDKRKKAALLLKKTIEEELKELGILYVKFEAKVEATTINENGSDKVTFYISPNAGEELKPMAEIVSSGEAARVMLALKKALIKVDPIPVLIFDEIDAQIGGRLGTVTGKKLKEISHARQVILITHLPQIASFADSHFKVSKEVKNGRTMTNVDLLDEKSRVKELAKMMSGEKESKIALSHAEDMLAKAGHRE